MRPYLQCVLKNGKECVAAWKGLFLVFVQTTLCNHTEQNMHSENVWNSDYVHMTVADQQWGCYSVTQTSITASYLLMAKKLLIH